MTTHLRIHEQNLAVLNKKLSKTRRAYDKAQMRLQNKLYADVEGRDELAQCASALEAALQMLEQERESVLLAMSAITPDQKEEMRDKGLRHRRFELATEKQRIEDIRRFIESDQRRLRSPEARNPYELQRSLGISQRMLEHALKNYAQLEHNIQVLEDW